MGLPTRTEQQAAEARSYNILQYKIEQKVGIFRRQTENDFGIDFEIELESRKQVTGRSIKAQVKSSKGLKPRRDGVVTVGGVKQSTLLYWCSVSQQTNVIAYAVDLESETISVTGNLFWQATQLIDGGEKTKSIEFLPAGDQPDERAVLITLLHFAKPTVPVLVAAHRTALRNLAQALELLADAHHYDAGSTLHEPQHFNDLLEVCKIILWGQEDELWPDKRDRAGWDDPAYWDAKAMDEGWGELCYFSIQPVLGTLIPALIKRLRDLRKAVLAGKFYWAHNDPRYLKSVYATALPDDLSIEGLREAARCYERHQLDSWDADRFVDEARRPPNNA